MKLLPAVANRNEVPDENDDLSVEALEVREAGKLLVESEAVL